MDNSPAASSKASAGLERSLLILSFAVSAVAFYYFLRNWFRPYPLTCRENADFFETALLLNGKNPYSLDQHPLYVYVYGIVQSLLTYPLAAVFGQTLPVIRTPPCLALLLDSVVLYWALRLSRISPLLALTGALLLFDHLAFVMTAAPDDLGVFFLLLSVVVPYAGKFSPLSLLGACVLSLLAFYTKPYFILGLPFLITYLFLFRDKILAVGLGATFVALLSCSIAIVGHYLPLYFTDTYYAHLNAENPQVAHLLGILRDFSPRAIGLVAILGWWMAYTYLRTPSSERWSFRLDLTGLRAPLIKKPALQWPTFLLLAFSAIYVFKMGLHVGGSINYVYNIVLPFLIWRAYMVAGAEAPHRTMPLRLLVLTVFFVGLSLVALHTYRLVAVEKKITASWQHAAELISTHHDIFAARAFSGLLWQQGKPVYDTGQTEYYPMGIPHNPSSLMPEYTKRGEAYQQMLASKLHEKKFDLIMLFPIDSPLLPEKDLLPYYHKTETFHLWLPYLSYDVDVWEPLP